MKYRYLKRGETGREGDQVRLPSGWDFSDHWMFDGHQASGMRYRRPIKGEAQKTPRTKAKKISVAAKRSHNNRYATALEVFNVFNQECRHDKTLCQFREWCEQRLNADNGTSHS